METTIYINIVDAINLDDIETVHRLLSNCTNINILDNCNYNRNWSPLHFASKRGNFEIVKLLLAYGANPNTRNDESWTPLMIACDVKYQSPLMNTCNDDVEIIKLLLEHGADPNMQTRHGDTPLYIARDRKFEIIKLLLEHGADPNHLLRYACRYGNFKIVKLLLEHGADPNIQYFDKIPLIVASCENKHDIIMILIDYGANCNLIDWDGKTALDYKGGNFIREYLESKEHQILLK